MGKVRGLLVGQTHSLLRVSRAYSPSEFALCKNNSEAIEEKASSLSIVTITY